MLRLDNITEDSMECQCGNILKSKVSYDLNTSMAFFCCNNCSNEYYVERDNTEIVLIQKNEQTIYNIAVKNMRKNIINLCDFYEFNNVIVKDTYGTGISNEKNKIIGLERGKTMTIAIKNSESFLLMQKTLKEEKKRGRLANNTFLSLKI